MIWQQLRIALGLGQGVTTERSYRGANRRGRIAEYKLEAAEELGASHCLVVTEPGYSRTSLQQITIPILDEEEYESRPGDVVVDRTSAAWFSGVFGGAKSLILAVPMITSVYEGDSLAGYSRTGISESTMHEVESALVRHFGL